MSEPQPLVSRLNEAVYGKLPNLAAATALWFGFPHLLDYLISASLFGSTGSLHT